MDRTPCRNEYMRRVHAVQDYIESCPDSPPRLSALAEIAGFSKYHFHRIFRAITGETLLQYVNRIRLERAAAYLVHAGHVPVTDIAYHFDFTDSTSFSRSFRAHFGVSPTTFRHQYSKNCQAAFPPLPYTQGIRQNETGSDSMAIQATGVETMAIDLRVIYIRHTGGYRELASVIPAAIRKLYGFAVQRQLLEPAETRILTAYHDNPDLTDDPKLRVSVCISIRKTAKVEAADDIGVMDLTGDYAVGHFALMPADYGAAWQYMYGEWLPNGGYQPRDTFPFEVYVSDPTQNPGGKQLLDVCIPVEPLGQI